MYFVFQPGQPGKWAGPASYNQAIRLVGELVCGEGLVKTGKPKEFCLKNEKSLLIF